MDIYCPKCSEPFDTAEFSDIADELGITIREATVAFLTDGCSTIPGAKCNGSGGARGAATKALFDLCGDDVDGIASTLDDFIYVGLVD